METKQIGLDSLELKMTGDGMKFSGYASIFGGVDSYGDTIQKGAYLNTLENRQRPIRMRWNHYGPVIGKWTELREDEKGLYVAGELTPGHSTAEDTYALMKHGAIDGMSIGYRVKAFDPLGEDLRLLKEIDLVEISVVEEPADLGAKIGDVKSALESASTIREIESILRDSAGFSRANATYLVSRMKSVLQGELAAEEKAKQELAALFQKFTHS